MKKHIAIDSEGRLLPYNDEQIQKITDDSISKGELVLVVMRVGNDLCANVMGEPSKEVLNTLEEIVKAYKQALRGN